MSFPPSANTMFQLNPVAVVADIAQHRALLRHIAMREIKGSYRGSLLGVGWIVLIPLIRMSIYTFVFGFIFKARFSMSSTEGPLEFALGIFLGLTVFQLIADGIGSGPSVILRNSNLVKKIAFPVIVLPVAAAASSMFNFLVGSIVTMIAVIALGIGLSITQFWYVAIVVPRLRSGDRTVLVIRRARCLSARYRPRDPASFDAAAFLERHILSALDGAGIDSAHTAAQPAGARDRT